MSSHCPNVVYGIPGSLRACSGEAGHDGECVFDRTPSQEELARHAVTWSVPVPDPTNERIKELEAEVAEWREVGKALEFSRTQTYSGFAEYNRCHFCVGGKGFHAPGCNLARLLEKP